MDAEWASLRAYGGGAEIAMSEHRRPCPSVFVPSVRVLRRQLSFRLEP